MASKQIHITQLSRRLLLTRWIIFVVWSIILTFIVGAWILSSGRIIPYDLSFILTGILILCGILFTLYAFLFPKQPIDSEIRELSTSKLVHVKDLRSKSLLQLGDESAANFPYVIDPIQGLFNDTVQILLDASTDITRIKRGILIYGESNAGKTRLALETLQRTLPFWPVLRWKPVDTMD